MAWWDAVLWEQGLHNRSSRQVMQSVVREIDENFLAKGIGRITKGFEKLCERGKMSVEAKNAMLGRLSGTVSLTDLSSCDLVIEAVFEEMSVKKELFKALDAICKRCGVLARVSPPSQTST